jgi:hypothetical protein
MQNTFFKTLSTYHFNLQNVNYYRKLEKLEIKKYKQFTFDAK